MPAGWKPCEPLVRNNEGECHCQEKVWQSWKHLNIAGWRVNCWLLRATNQKYKAKLRHTIISRVFTPLRCVFSCIHWMCDQETLDATLKLRNASSSLHNHPPMQQDVHLMFGTFEGKFCRNLERICGNLEKVQLREKCRFQFQNGSQDWSQRWVFLSYLTSNYCFET